MLGIYDDEVIYRYVLARLYMSDRCVAADASGIPAREAAAIDSMILGGGLTASRRS